MESSTVHGRVEVVFVLEDKNQNGSHSVPAEAHHRWQHGQLPKKDIRDTSCWVDNCDYERISEIYTALASYFLKIIFMTLKKWK